MGYHRAGFDVVGIDLFEKYVQGKYPFPSWRGDALEALDRLLSGEQLTFTHANAELTAGLSDFAVWCGSPPCQAYSITKHTHANEHPELVDPVRDRFLASGLPYVMENVVGAPLQTALTLCGTEFDLTAVDTDGTRLFLRRHRLFESNVFLWGAGGCRCVEYRRKGFECAGVYGGGSTDRRHARDVRRGGYTPSPKVQRQLMGIDWTTSRNALNQAIPPVYTEHIGRQLLEAIT